MLASAVSPSPKEAQRLGKNGSDEIKNHEFFRGINFKKEALVIFAEDTSNFDPIDEGKLRPDRNSNYEFTFRRFFDDACQPVFLPGPNAKRSMAIRLIDIDVNPSLFLIEQ